VPISSSKRLREVADLKSIPAEQLREMEEPCLTALADLDGTEETNREVVESGSEFGPFIERRGADKQSTE
jgi:hypothetical protein